MLRPVHRALFFFVTVALLVGCRRSGDESPDIIVTAEPEFIVDLFELRDPANGHPTFGLWVETVRIYECPGYRLEATVAVDDASVAAEFLGLVRPEPCAGAAEPVRQFVPIGNLADRSYDFSLHVGALLHNDGELAVAGGAYSLHLPGPGQGVDFRSRTLRHIPDQLVWGYIRTPDELSQDPAENLLADLKALTADPTLAPDQYGYFTVSGTQLVTLHPAFAPAGPYRVFVRRLKSDPDALRGLLQQYRTAATPLEVRCWSTVGEL